MRHSAILSSRTKDRGVGAIKSAIARLTLRSMSGRSSAARTSVPAALSYCPRSMSSSGSSASTVPLPTGSDPGVAEPLKVSSLIPY